MRLASHTTFVGEKTKFKSALAPETVVTIVAEGVDDRPCATCGMNGEIMVITDTPPSMSGSSMRTSNAQCVGCVVGLSAFVNAIFNPKK